MGCQPAPRPVQTRLGSSDRDDQALVRHGFHSILADEDDIDVVCEAADGFEALERAAALRPDIVLMDIRVPLLDGLTATKRLLTIVLAYESGLVTPHGRGQGPPP